MKYNFGDKIKIIGNPLAGVIVGLNELDDLYIVKFPKKRNWTYVRESQIESIYHEESVTPESDNYKHDTGKPQLSLVPPEIIEAVGRVRTFGNKKYKDPTSWRKVEPRRYKDALMRHLVEYLRDENSKDEESGLNHLEHVACNVALLLEFLRDKKHDD